MVNNIPEKDPYHPINHIGALRINDNSRVDYRYLAHKLEQLGKQEAFLSINRVSIGVLKKLPIVTPDIK